MWRYREEADGGIHLGLGTDWPAVMSIDPIDTVYAAVTRSEFDGHPAEGYFRENALTLGETLQAHTLGSAYVEALSAVWAALPPASLPISSSCRAIRLK